MHQFKGYTTALITPFKNGEIDWNAYENLIEWQIASGIHGLVPCGTTGESPTLSHEEHMEVVRRCVNAANKRVPVIAGTGSNSTTEAIGLTHHAKEAGADAALVVTPYYNKPSQEGLYQHYRAVQDVGLPVIIYNIPGRSVIDMSLETMARLAKLPNIVGVKDATNDLSRPLMTRTKIGPGFRQLSGEDATIGAFLGQGGHGCISVTANIVPGLCVALYNAWEAGDLETFGKLRDRLAPIHKALFCETSPAPVKYAASRLGLSTDEVRLPLVPASENARKIVDAAMEEAGVQANSESTRKAANA
ncbi:MAG: 4-hydroxy-tetrahydrodipicolinate synthase [Alphaproteobacteria bacterium]|nr:4-hydroxy-tetrahydrodipicolinate synthase [Alphaproteobacteria bacterium]